MKHLAKSIFFGLSILMICHGSIIAEPSIEWDGYLQTRFSADFKNTNDIMIRRGKLWIKGSVPETEKLFFKLQGVYRSFKDNTLMIQDVYAELMGESYKLRIGRMVPDFSLQWNQPDAVIPVLERGQVIDGLIHGDKSTARMIGVQYLYQPENNGLHLGVGVFNANLTPPGKNSDQSFLYTLHTSYNLLNRNSLLAETGLSIAYRKLDNLTLPKIFDPTSLISGDDLRFGFETLLKIRKFEIQAEYLEAEINHQKAYGYYAYLNCNCSDKNQIIVAYDKFVDINRSTNDAPWLIAGYNHLFLDNKVKLMMDFRVQDIESTINYMFNMQGQIFFN